MLVPAAVPLRVHNLIPPTGLTHLLAVSNNAFGDKPGDMVGDPIKKQQVRGGRLRAISGGPRGVVLNLSQSPFYGQFREDRFLLWNFFADMASEPPRALLLNGTFLEIGACDGISISNSLFFEESLGWSGLLVEADPINFAKLRQTRRAHRATGKLAVVFGQNDPATAVPEGSNVMVEAAVSSHEAVITMGGVGTITTVIDDPDHDVSAKRNPGERRVKMRGMPMRKLMRKYTPSIHHIDLLSVDIEGHEPVFVDTFPWAPAVGGVSVGVLVVEVTQHRQEIIEAVHRNTKCGLLWVKDKGVNAYFVNTTWHTTLVTNAHLHPN